MKATNIKLAAVLTVDNALKSHATEPLVQRKMAKGTAILRQLSLAVTCPDAAEGKENPSQAA